jgi:hypothetical protein
MLKRLSVLLVGTFIFTGNLCAADGVLDLTGSCEGTKVLEAYSGTPDSHGVLETYGLVVPPFKRGVYYRGPWWPYGGNRVSGQIITKPEGQEGGIFLLLELEDGRYLSVLPLGGTAAYAWLSPRDGQLQMKLGTHGTAPVSGRQPLVSWVCAESPYEACYLAWKQASETEQITGWMKLREQKKYPEIFNWLGWCSWEGYHKGITSDKLVAEFQGLEKSSVPIRYFLVDDGHFDQESLAPKEITFPKGYKPLTDLRSYDGIRWVGMWHALLGEQNGIPEGQPEAILESMMLAHNGRMIPKPDAGSIETFFRYTSSHSKQDAVDFLKVDFCGALLSVLCRL